MNRPKEILRWVLFFALGMLFGHAASAEESVTLRPVSNGKVFGGPMRLAIETEFAEAGGKFALTNNGKADYVMFVKVRLNYEDAEPVELMTFDGESPARIAERMRIGRGFSSLYVLVNLRHRTCRSGPDERIEFDMYRNKFDEIAMHRIARGILKRLNRRYKLLRSTRLRCEEAR